MIKRIIIKNFKSIESLSLDINSKDIICLIGKNGSGKSNIFKAIKYFFEHINKPYSDEQIIDSSNPYLQKCEISILFHLKLLKEKSRRNSELSRRFSIIDKYLDKYIDNDEEDILKYYDLELTMKQYQDGTIKWNIVDKDICETIKTMFPFYYIDTRRLDIFTWEQLWKIISDLSAAMPHIKGEEYRNTLDKAFTQIYGDKYTNSKERIEKAFQENNISLDPYHFNSKFKSAFSMRFGGDLFLVDGQPLSYFSDGTNSFKYLILLTTLIPQISEISCKYPIILIDEPEIGLHSEFISEFVNCISEKIKGNALMIFNTHSPKLIVDLTNIKIDYQLYKITRIEQHTTINKMNTNWLSDSKHKITLKETECYFYDYLVYVEGETEVELFNNKRLQSLFPKIKKIHFYSFDGNHERLNSVNSSNLNLGTEYKLLIDMDEVLQYETKRQKFKIKPSDINPIHCQRTSKENIYTYYNPKKTDLHSIIKTINELISINYEESGKDYNDSENFIGLLSNIQMYCKAFNTIVNWSTIEGEIITYENLNKFLDFISSFSIRQKEQHRQIVQNSDAQEKYVLVLLEFLGKTEYFKSRKKIKYSSTEYVKAVIDSKTSGWVSKWLDYYFINYIEPLSTLTEKRVCFKRDFPGLFSTLQQFENMIK